MRKHFLYLLFIVIAASLPFDQAFGQKKTIFDLMETNSVLNLELEADLDSLVIIKNTPTYIPATLRYEEEDSQMEEWTIKLRSRGKYRRRICDFPPLTLKFPKSDLKEEGLKKHNSLKLVTHCFISEGGDEVVLREYLIYKLYQILTDSSFRAQLAKVKYINSNNGVEVSRVGFILEDEDELAKRLDAKVCEDCYGKKKEDFEDENVYLHELFQYMISNTDWSIQHLRNLKILQPKDSSKCIVIPYDFDFSGLVNAPYLIMNAELGQKSGRDRKYIGFATSSEELRPTIEHFLSKKEALFDCVNNFEHLSTSSRKDICKYMKSFYKLLEKDRIFGKE